MKFLIKLILLNLHFFFFSANLSFSQDQDVGEILENIQKDLRTLERQSTPNHFLRARYKCKPESINQRS